MPQLRVHVAPFSGYSSVTTIIPVASAEEARAKIVTIREDGVETPVGVDGAFAHYLPASIIAIEFEAL